MTRFRLLAALSAASLLFAAPVQSVWAQTAKPAAKLPTAQKILDDSTAATGGKAAFAKIKSVVIQGTITIPAQKITGTVESRIALPDRVYSKQELAGYGKFEQGYDGKIGWSRDPVNGLRTLANTELRQIKEQADEFRNTDWRTRYSKAEVLGVRKVGTAKAYAVRFTPKSGGSPTVTFFDIQTHLPIRSDITVASAQGAIPTQTFLSNYRTVEGLKLPFTSRQVIGATSEVLVTFTSVRFNEPVDATLFVKPAAPAPKPDAPAKP